MATTARKDLQRAAEFGVTTLIIQDDVEYMFAWNATLDRLCMYDFSLNWRRQGQAQQAVGAVRANYREITAEARQRGIDSYHDRVQPIENLRVVWSLAPSESGAERLRLLTPDELATSGWLTCACTQTKGRVRLEFVIPKLRIWTIVRAQAAGG